MDGNNHLRFYVQDEQGDSAYVDTPLVLDQWWYVAATFDDEVMRLYTNGVLAAQATGTPPLHYQWFFNGQPLTGQIQDFLILSNAQPAEAGDYSLQVSNLYGVSLSSNAC